ncbi:MAG: glutarate dioxygenase GlaH [Endozoicomonas sp.]
MTAQPAPFSSLSSSKGYSIVPHSNNQRLQVITLSSATISRFRELIAQWDLQAIEYKPFLRFAVADALDRACGKTLGKCLLDILKNRETGAFLLQYEGEVDGENADFNVKLSTAVSHLVGVPNFDSMYGKYYARFAVQNQDNSDSYLRKAHRRMELHNDGTYVDERTDFVLMMKLAEENVEGGDSLLLHMDDWRDLDHFYSHPQAKRDILWGSPPSKNIDYKISHPVFFEEDDNGNPKMLFIDQFAEPRNMAQGLYLHAMGESLESDDNCFNVRLQPGAMLVIQNHVWLHGRDKFIAHQGLYRELLRQRGQFSE